MKSLLLSFVILILTSCTHRSVSRVPTGDELPRHIVIAVHGIGGNESTWGSLGDVLTHHLGALNPHYRYEFYNFEYPTGTNGRNTFDFGHQDLGRFIQKVFAERDIQPQDRITFVAHSQGGLVSTIWYVDSLMAGVSGTPEDLKPLVPFVKYARNVDAIVTLGTPFWGSKLAARLTDKTRIDVSRLANLNNPRELEEMTFGSNTIYKFRRSAIAISRKPALRSQITARMVNISGIFPLDRQKLYYRNVNWSEPDIKITTLALNFVHDYFTKIGFGYDRYESDIAVLVPNSRIDFLYGEDLSDDGNGQIRFQSADLFSGQRKHIMTESVHTAVNSKYNVAMALIPSYCQNVAECLHPTYRYILEEVANCAVNDCDQDVAKQYFSTLAKVNAEDVRTNLGLAENLRGFTLDVVLRLPDYYDIEDPRFKTLPGISFSDVQLNGDGNGTFQLSGEKFFRKAVKLDSDSSGVINGTSPFVRAQIGDSTEYLSKFVTQQSISFRGRSHTDMRITLTGTIIPTKKGVDDPLAYEKAIQEGVEIPLEFNLPGLVPRKATAVVKPGISSFLELTTRYKQ